MKLGMVFGTLLDIEDNDKEVLKGYLSLDSQQDILILAVNEANG